MTPQPEQELIALTKGELGEIIDLTESMTLNPGWIEEIQSMANKRMTIINTARSRPATSDLLLPEVVGAIEQAKMQAAAQARETVDTLLNNRIAKMEILDMKNPSPFRKGALMAYRDIEESLRSSTKEATP